ncbi:MAG: F0F1 ATP synthase subunit delta [Pseudomonadota bacterium]
MASTSLSSGVAGRYASALLDLAESGNAIDATEADLDTLKSMLADSDDLRRLVESPAFTTDDQARAMAAVLKGAKISGLTAQFIGVVSQNRRLFALTGIIDAYKTMAADKRGEVAAQVTSAVPLSKKQRDELVQSLKRKLGLDVALEETVDPSILGGLIVRIGSKMIDTSIKTKLNALKYAMKEAG